MKRASFSIYDASAGSGKTYNLVREYLKIILASERNDAYRNILAITFTNKAVHEMKSRIILSLSEFSKEQPAPKMQKLLRCFFKTNVEEVERSHQDGIMINNESSEAFDEVFFQVYESNIYSFKNYLNEYESEHINSYIEFINHFLITNKRNIYITKNNNHILRLPQIIESGKFKILITFRNPLTHAASLEKQDLIHSNLQKENTFVLDYMNYLGHFEFGLNKKYFKFRNERVNVTEYEGIDFWLAQWINYYGRIIELTKKYQGINLINFEDWCSKEKFLLRRINNITGLTIFNKDIYFPAVKSSFNVDGKLLKIAENIFQELLILYRNQL